MNASRPSAITLRTVAFCGTLIALARWLQQKSRQHPQLHQRHQQLLLCPPRLPLVRAHQVPRPGRHLRHQQDLRATTPSSIRAFSSAPRPRRKSSSSPASRSTTTTSPTRAAPPGPPTPLSLASATSAMAIARSASIDSSTPTTSDPGATTQVVLPLHIPRCSRLGYRSRNAERLPAAARPISQARRPVARL